MCRKQINESQCWVNCCLAPILESRPRSVSAKMWEISVENISETDLNLTWNLVYTWTLSCRNNPSCFPLVYICSPMAPGWGCSLQKELCTAVALLIVMHGRLEPGWPATVARKGDRIWLLGAVAWGQDLGTLGQETGRHRQRSLKSPILTTFINMQLLQIV